MQKLNCDADRRKAWNLGLAGIGIDAVLSVTAHFLAPTIVSVEAAVVAFIMTSVVIIAVTDTVGDSF